MKVAHNAVIGDELPNLAEAPLESTHSANSNVVLSCVGLCSYATVVFLHST